MVSNGLRIHEDDHFSKVTVRRGGQVIRQQAGNCRLQSAKGLKACGYRRQNGDAFNKRDGSQRGLSTL